MPTGSWCLNLHTCCYSITNAVYVCVCISAEQTMVLNVKCLPSHGVTAHVVFQCVFSRSCCQTSEHRDSSVADVGFYDSIAAPGALDHIALYVRTHCIFWHVGWLHQPAKGNS
jgi:hypothetical protein